MSNSKDTTKRKVSKTGVLSYKGCKYYIKEKELKGQTVEVVRESEHQTLTIKYGETTAIARQFDMVTFSSIAKRKPENDDLIISPQGYFRYKGKRYFVESPQFHSRKVIIEEIKNQIQVKLAAVPMFKCLAEPAEGEFK
jgi:hypothetical protein